ncbi:MAG TPA: alpha/beta fold hydrolase, partial [Thermoanaerobaculia bacterium]|nr:alpha/beta fold hydrolase [Thermoanaerobaculia bacterium]
MTRATAEMRPPAATAFAYSLALLLALAGLTAPPARGADPAAIRWQTATLEGHHGKTAEAQLGRLTVPMRRDAPDAGSVELALLRLPSRAATPGPPIVFLAGGPGGSGIGAGRIPGYFETFVALTELADVILLDQRGTGASTPRLFCPATSLPSPRLFADWAAARRFLVDGAVACRDTLAAQGVDLAGFHSVESADDLDDLRHALGAEKISLLGFSYGTHLAAAAMRRHGERLHR